MKEDNTQIEHSQQLGNQTINPPDPLGLFFSEFWTGGLLEGGGGGHLRTSKFFSNFKKFIVSFIQNLGRWSEIMKTDSHYDDNVSALQFCILLVCISTNALIKTLLLLLLL